MRFKIFFIKFIVLVLASFVSHSIVKLNTGRGNLSGMWMRKRCDKRKCKFSTLRCFVSHANVSFYLTKKKKESRKILEIFLYLCANRNKKNSEILWMKSTKWKIEISTVINVVDNFHVDSRNVFWWEITCKSEAVSKI